MGVNSPRAADLPLAGLRVLECASFVAGPSGCMTLAQLGADIVRVDPLGGAADHHRWPISATGTSLYWMALNKGKRSVTIDFRSPAGRELVVALATESSQDAGIVVENNVGRPWLSYAALSERRPDMIQLHIQGQSDGRPAVDYTVNAEVGIPDITGPDGLVGPVNHVLPAWDLLTGTTAATGLLAALLRRDRTGCGANLEIALADVALAGVASLGWLAEADELGTDRPRQGNHVYGSFGVDFTTEDGHRVMVVALTVRHWDALRTVTGTAKVFAALEEAMSVDLAADGDRYRLREMVAAVLRPWFAARPLREVGRKLDEAGVLWSRYRSMTETVSDFRSGKSVPVLAEVTQPGIGQMLSTRSPIRLDAAYGDAHPAPRLGQHTDEVLADVLGLNDHQIGRLHDRRVIGATV